MDRKFKDIPYHERVRMYEKEKKSVLEMCVGTKEIERALFLLAKKWRI